MSAIISSPLGTAKKILVGFPLLTFEHTTAPGTWKSFSEREGTVYLGLSV
jgi:hypothetical protein